MKLKIVHVGDMQIEIKSSGGMAQRLSEMTYVLNKAAAYIKKENPDIVTIVGDIYQIYAANGDETKLFGKFLRDILPYCKAIRVIPGNHDIKQKNNSIIENAQSRISTDAIESVISNIDHHKIEYYKHTGFYVDATFDITWAVWSQIDKHSPVDPKPEYSPWSEPHNKITGGLIELFHDPIRNSVNFDGKSIKGTEEYGITFNSFKSNTVLAGDIHNPYIFQKDNFTFAYCSSLIQRNFGEAHYYADDKITVNGNDRHGLNVVEFDTELDAVTDIKFVPIEASVGRHTIHLSKDFNYDLISTLKIEPKLFNYIKLVINGNVAESFARREELIKHFVNKYECDILITYSANATSDTEIQALQSVEELLDKDKVIELGDMYIEDKVEKTKTIDADMKDQAKQLFKQLFRQELDKIDLSSSSEIININSAAISNFMTFANEVTIDFPNLNITVINGSNGVGKTTVFYFLSWMFTDYVNPYQSARSQKQNYLQYFNDRSEADVVKGHVDFLRNGKLHRLTKTLTRTWKRGKSHALEADWRSYVSGVQLSMSLESPDCTSTDSTEILEYLNSIITVKEFHQMMLFNQKTVDDLVHSNPDDLNKQILQNIGLNFFDNMLNRYDDLRDTMMAKVTKPQSTVEQLLQFQKESEEKIRLSNEGIEKVKELSAQADEGLKKLIIDKEEHLKSLHNVGTVEDVNTKIQTSATNILSINNDLVELTTEKSRLQSKLITANSDNRIVNEAINKIKNDKSLLVQKTESDKDKLDVLLDRINSEKSNLVNVYTAAVAKHAEGTEVIKLQAESIARELLDLQDNKQNIVTLFNTEQLRKTDEVRSAIAKNDEEILSLQKHKQTMIEKFNEDKNQKIANVQQIISSNNIKYGKHQEIISGLNAEASKIVADKQILTSEIAVHNTDISNSKELKTCKACNREHNEQTLIIISKNIEQYNEAIEKKRQQILDLDAQSTELARKIIIQQDICKELTDDSTKQSESIADVSKTTVDTAPEYVKVNEDIQHILDNNVKHADKITDINTVLVETIPAHIAVMADIKTLTESHATLLRRIEDIKATAKETAKSDQTVIDAKESVIKLTNEHTILDASVKEFDTKSIQFDLAIQTESDKLIDIEALTVNIETNSTAIDTKTKDKISEDLSNVALKQDLVKASADVIVNEYIETVKVKITNTESTIVSYNNDMFTVRSTIDRIEREVAQSNTDIINIKKYYLVDAVMKLYKSLVNKKGLPQYIFGHIIPIINEKLNELLSDVQFRLFFDSGDLTMKMIDLSKNITRPVTYASGMETTFLGLVLISTMQQINVSKKSNIMLMDEMTGKLNDGSTLQYEAPDYQRIFVKLLKKMSKSVSIYIVDHVIERGFEDRVITIHKTDKGSVIE